MQDCRCEGKADKGPIKPAGGLYGCRHTARSKDVLHPKMEEIMTDAWKSLADINRAETFEKVEQHTPGRSLEAQVLDWDALIAAVSGWNPESQPEGTPAEITLARCVLSLVMGSNANRDTIRALRHEMEDELRGVRDEMTALATTLAKIQVRLSGVSRVN